MAFLKSVKKAVLVALASEMEIEISGEMTRAELRERILQSGEYEEGATKNLLTAICEDQKMEADREAEFRKREVEEKQREAERAYNLEMERLRIQALEIERAPSENGSVGGGPTDNGERGARAKSLEEVIRTVKLLTVKIPSRPEGWDFFRESGKGVCK